MATTTSNVTNGGGTNALGILFDRKVIESLQPQLYFEQVGIVRMVASGNYTDRYSIFDQIATSSVGTLTEGTAPTGVAVTLTVKDATPTQYGVSIEMTDLAVLTTMIDLVTSTSAEVAKAIARKIDSVIQTVANAGTQVYYAGGKASRASLAAGDLIDATLILKAAKKLDKGSAPKFPDGSFRAIMSVDQAYDLRSNYSVGQWIDVSKYAQPGEILLGEEGKIHGVRLMSSSNVDTFASTVTVHPCLVAGYGGFTISYWLPGRVKSYIITPETATISNPLGQKGSVGGKVNMGVVRTQEARLVRIESAATSL